MSDKKDTFQSDWDSLEEVSSPELQSQPEMVQEESFAEKYIPQAVQNLVPDMLLPDENTARAATKGAASGFTFGTMPIGAGLVGAAGEAISGEPEHRSMQLAQAQKLMDLYKESKGKKGLSGEELKALGVPTEEQSTLGRLKEAYYGTKKEYTDEDAELLNTNPTAYIGGQVVGGIVGAKALPGIGSVKETPGLLSKVLGTGSGTGGMRIANAAEMGAKAGALTGFGSGEAKLGEGDILGTVGQTLVGAGIGGAAGGGVQAVGEGLKTAGKHVAKTFLGEGYKYGKETGKSLNVENIDKDIKVYAKKLYDSVDGDINAITAKRDEIAKSPLAEKIKIKLLNEIDETINKTQQLDIRKENIGDIKKFEESLGSFKAADPAEVEWAENVIKESKLKLPESSIDKSDIEKAKAILKHEASPFTKYDLENISLADAKKIQDTIANNYSPMARENALVKDKGVLDLGKDLSLKIQNMSDDALDKLADVSGVDLVKLRKMKSDLISAKSFMGVDDQLSVKKADDLTLKINKIRKLISGQSDDSKMTREAVVESLEKGGLTDIGKHKEMIAKLNRLKGITGGSDTGVPGSVSVKKAVLEGGIERAGANLASQVGKGARAVSAAGEGFKRLLGYDGSKLQSLASKGGPFADQLSKAISATPNTRNIILYGLYDQPGFKAWLAKQEEDESIK